MLTLKGKLINIFVQPKGEKEGREYGGQSKVQIIGDIRLPNGESKVDMITLTSHDISDFKDLTGKDIIVPVGVMPSGKSVVYFIPKGSKPSLSTIGH